MVEPVKVNELTDPNDELRFLRVMHAVVKNIC